MGIEIHFFGMRRQGQFPSPHPKQDSWSKNVAWIKSNLNEVWLSTSENNFFQILHFLSYVKISAYLIKY